MERSYDIKPRPTELGGGVCPPEDDTEEALQEAFADAQNEGESWAAPYYKE
jgi:hypothetical protein